MTHPQDSAKPDPFHLSKREREIMEVVFQNGASTAKEIHEGLTKPPTLSAIRALIRILESKGHLKHRKDGVRHVYYPTKPVEKTRKAALRKVVDTFFGGSVSKAFTSLVSDQETQLNEEEWQEILDLAKQHKGSKGSK